MASPLTPTDLRRFELITARLERTGTPLQNGDTGGAVGALERLLTSLGFTPGEVDTAFDPTTQGTVKNFQAAMGLEPTGIVDEKTVTALRTALTNARNAPGFVQRGRKGEDIATVERQLARLGYDVGKRDGISDGQLGKAIVAFKADQKSEFANHSAVLGTRGIAILDREAKALNHAAYRGRHQLTMGEHRMDGVLGELAKRKNADGTVGVGPGAERPAFTQLQARLRAAGFDPKRSDGVFDERTGGALKAFQRANALEVTGRLDPATWKKLRTTIIDSDEAAAPKQKLNEKSRAVLATEKLLQKAGFAAGVIDGRFDRATASAVRAFERLTRRTVDGEMGSRDLARLKQLVKSPFIEPKSDYSRHSFRGVTLNARTIEMLEQAERWSKQHGGPSGWGMFQGSYNPGGVDDSAHTHDRGGAFDMNTEGKSLQQIHKMVEALRRAGFAAWHRPWDDNHIHAIAIGDREMHPEAHDQVVEYFNKGDGLSGSLPDPHGAIGRPMPAWARKFG